MSLNVLFLETLELTLAPGASLVVTHGLYIETRAVRPDLIIPDRMTPLSIPIASVNTTTFTITNTSNESATSKFLAWAFKTDFGQSADGTVPYPLPFVWGGLGAGSPDQFLNQDFVQYVSAVNGNDSNDGLSRQLVLAAGGTTNNPTVQTGTLTTVDTAGGPTVLAMIPNDPLLIGKELRLLHTVAPGVASSSNQLITGNSATGFTVANNFDQVPVVGDTFLVVSPIQTWDQDLNRLPSLWGRKNQSIYAKENGPVPGQTGSTASIPAGVAAGFPGSGLMIVTGLTGMTPLSVGHLLQFGSILTSGVPVGAGPTAGSNRGTYQIATFISASSVAVKNPFFNGNADGNNGAISWTELFGYASNSKNAWLDTEGRKCSASPDETLQATPPTFVGDFLDVFGTLSADAGTSSSEVVSAGLLALLPTGVITAITAVGAGQITPVGGQTISGFVGLTVNAHGGKWLLMTNGAGVDTARRIVCNDATSVTVTPAFAVAPQNPVVGNSMIIDVTGLKILMLTGTAAGQRRFIREVARTVTGTTTSTTATVLTDGTLALATNELVGRVLTYTSGPAAGQTKTITSNTATTITTTAFAPAPTPGGGNTYSLLGGVIVHTPFAPAPVAGDTYRVERAAVPLNMTGNLEIQGGADYILTKGFQFIYVTANGGITQTGTSWADEGSEVDQRNQTTSLQVNAFQVEGSTIATIEPQTIYSALRPVGQFYDSGTVGLAGRSQKTGHFMSNNNTYAFTVNSTTNMQTCNGRQFSLTAVDSRINCNANATILSKMNRSKVTTATSGMLAMTNSILGTNATNMNIINGLGHAITLSDCSIGNLGAVSGSGNAGIGLCVTRESRCEISAAGTTVTGALGDTRTGSSADGVPAVIGVIRTYAQLNQTKGFTANNSIVSFGTRTESVGGSTTVVHDGTLALVVNDYEDCMIAVLSGANVGQMRHVISNAATTLTVDVAFGANVDIGDTWQIVPGDFGARIDVRA